MFDKAVSFCGGKLEYKDVAATLNVLDYDTYFGVTRALFEGDYKSTLMTFDEVLKKGFSGQTFASGLASHMRDLLMCKDPQTLPLLEMSGSLLERYRLQSQECDINFLFNAISLLGAIDGGFRTATNQRLHVELGLMRIANLGQKKNFDVATPALAPLKKEEGAPTPQQPVAKRVAPQNTPTPEPKPEPKAAPTPEPQAAPAPAPEPQRGEPQRPVATMVCATMGGATLGVATTDATPKSGGSETTKKLFGSSIGDIISGRAFKGEEGDKAVYYDPQTQQKINKEWSKFIEQLTSKHPRLGNAMMNTKVSGHTLSLSVPTEIIRDDLLRNQPEITEMLNQCCGVEGSIILDIEVKAEQEGSLPHRTIDKVHFLVEKNPELNTFIQDLGLDME
jgi:DNA polymerase-3 subunit gamma/tau